MRSTLVVAATLALDGVLFGANFLVALHGGSRAVLSQAVSSLTDMVGGAMLLWGLYAANQPPTPVHPFGRGKERFFWAFTAGLVTFTLAGSLLLVVGLLQALHPGTVQDVQQGLVTVSFAGMVGAGSLAVILAEIRRDGLSVQGLLESSHQGMKTVFLQDVVSLAGSGVALVGLGLDALTGNPRFDGVAASVVALLLLVTGVALAGETRALLVGKAMSDREATELLAIVERYPFVRQVLGMQSMLVGPEDILVALRVNFVDGLTTDEIEMHIDHLRFSIRTSFPAVRHLVIEPVSELGKPPAVP